MTLSKQRITKTKSFELFQTHSAVLPDAKPLFLPLKQNPTAQRPTAQHRQRRVATPLSERAAYGQFSSARWILKEHLDILHGNPGTSDEPLLGGAVERAERSAGTNGRAMRPFLVRLETAAAQYLLNFVKIDS